MDLFSLEQEKEDVETLPDAIFVDFVLEPAEQMQMYMYSMLLLTA